MKTPFSTIEAAIKALQLGQMIILVDDEGRENEGDLVIAAQFTTAQHINFMSKYGRGLICLPLDVAIVERLGLP
ncbi:MAG TPA: 3,4-dihydroxy-2-butanone-4-phosphate synthase, partial [Legionellaceae bacterium]|nr:3,4-dihydroxy-2-butanone-4-phosphate synthase [Legionellaceae bacterium]